MVYLINLSFYLIIKWYLQRYVGFTKFIKKLFLKFLIKFKFKILGIMTTSGFYSFFITINVFYFLNWNLFINYVNYLSTFIVFFLKKIHVEIKPICFAKKKKFWIFFFYISFKFEPTLSIDKFQFKKTIVTKFLI